ncbi:MAG: RNA polymerase sigma factor [Erysipelotrichales bacterium]|nr:RNA polymerase sigma factor [Erysipelotrichales bacterium]
MPFDEELFVPIDEETYSVFELLNLLPEKYRKVIILHELEGYRIEEVAKMLHLSVSAVKMRLLRAKNMLRNEVNKKENDCE